MDHLKTFWRPLLIAINNFSIVFKWFQKASITLCLFKVWGALETRPLLKGSTLASLFNISWSVSVNCLASLLKMSWIMKCEREQTTWSCVAEATGRDWVTHSGSTPWLGCYRPSPVQHKETYASKNNETNARTMGHMQATSGDCTINWESENRQSGHQSATSTNDRNCLIHTRQKCPVTNHMIRNV